MDYISERLKGLVESKTLEIAKLTRKLISEGKDIISLNLGEPDFDTPDFIKEAAQKSIDENYSHYPPVAGYADLRQAIADKFKRENGLDFGPEQIVVSTGAKQALANAMLSLLNPGDEVLVPSPYWVSYEQLVKLSGGTFIPLESKIEDQFKISPELLEKSITAKSKLFIFASPNNPTGTVFSKKELSAFADIISAHPNIWIISDEIYEHIQFNGSHESIAQFENVRDRCIVVNGVSKSFAMTGWRLGYMAAPVEIARACENIQGQITSGASAIGQRAAFAALTTKNDYFSKIKKKFLDRRDLLIKLISQIEGIKFDPPEGAFYLFPDISHYFGRTYNGNEIKNDNDLCLYLLHEAGIALVPGSAFGNPNCIRISYAASQDQITEALTRMKKALSRL